MARAEGRVTLRPKSRVRTRAGWRAPSCDRVEELLEGL
jgi:hypothetical protein